MGIRIEGGAQIGALRAHVRLTFAIAGSAAAGNGADALVADPARSDAAVAIHAGEPGFVALVLVVAAALPTDAAALGI